MSRQPSRSAEALGIQHVFVVEPPVQRTEREGAKAAKQREMGLGSLNLVPLAAARDIAVECRRQVLSGLDPLEERARNKRARHLEQARSITFQQAAELCIAERTDLGSRRSSGCSARASGTPSESLAGRLP